MNPICEKYSVLIEDLVAGEELDEATAAQAEAHIFACAACRSEYELLRREKEFLAHYMFEFEPLPDSWTDFQARLDADEKSVSDNAVFPVESPRRKKRIFALGFSPAFAVAAGLLLIFGIGFVLLKNMPLKRQGDKYAAELNPENSLSPQSDETGSKSAVSLQEENISAASDDAPQIDETKVKKQSLKTKNIFHSAKKLSAAETVKIKRATVFSGVDKKRNSEAVTNEEARAAMRRKQNLETEIADQIEKIELLLRAFRNAEADGAASFDVEYEKRQARKLLETNARLRRDAEIYGISDGEELLSRVDSYLLEIANLGDNPAPEKVLDIRERVSNQNIIAGLQIYSSVVAMK